MIEKRSEISDILMDKVADWLTQSSLAGDDLETMVRGFCERLAAAGLPLVRVHLSFSMLHPLYDALGFTWERGRGMEVEGFRKKTGLPSERFLHSPYYHLISNRLEHLRRRIDPDAPSEFPIFDDLKKIGRHRLHRLRPFLQPQRQPGHDRLAGRPTRPTASPRA